MTYATQTQLTQRFGAAMLVNLTDRAEVASGMIDADVIDRALADTDAMIDGYLAPRYILPLAEVPPLLADVAMQIAIYKLHVTEPDPKIAKDYDTALKMLRDIGSGVVRLSAAGVEPAGANANGVVVTDRARPFNAADMTGFI